MDAGLGNLIELKTHLLSLEHAEASTYDDVLLDIGKGIAAQFDKATNRALAYNAAHIDQFAANRPHWVTRAFPIVSIASLEIQDSYGDAWEAQTLTDAISSADLDSGILNFGAYLGSEIAQVRLTYAGGYWFDASEDFSGTLPTDATERPPDLKLAWLTQCAAVWEKLDVVGAATLNKQSRVTMAGLDFVPIVRSALGAFHRYMLS